MPDVPTPLKIALGLAAAAAEEVRKLPETLPAAATSVPMTAVATAMQASLRVQQHLAGLAARGEEVLAQLRGTSDEPPAWATFDDAPADPSGSDGSPMRAAFDRIDYDATGYPDSDEEPGRWDAVGTGAESNSHDAAGGSRANIDDVSADLGLAPEDLSRAAVPEALVVDAAARRAERGGHQPASTGKPAKKAPARRAPAKKAPAAKAAAKKAAKTPAPPAGAAGDAPAATKAAAAKAAPAKKAPAKKAPAKSAGTSLAEDLAAALVAESPDE